MLCNKRGLNNGFLGDDDDDGDQIPDEEEDDDEDGVINEGKNSPRLNLFSKDQNLRGH